MQIQIDFIGPLATTQGGYKYCLVIIDKFTKWIEAFPTKNCTALSAARVLLREVICRWGIPMTLDSDQGTHFNREVFTKLMTLFEIQHKLHIPYHPQSSGVVKRSKRTLKTLLKKFYADHPTQWVSTLPMWLMAIRSTPHATMGISPYQAMTGRLMRLPGCTRVMTQEALTQVSGNITLQGSAEETWMQNTLQSIQQTDKFVAQNTGRAKKVMERAYNNTTSITKKAIGDKVMIRVYGQIKSPFDAKWKGPFEILEKASPAICSICHPLLNRPSGYTSIR